MKSKRRKKKKYNRKITFIILLLVLVIGAFDIGLYFYTHKKDTRVSIHEFAKTYNNNSCRLYYPDTEKGLEVAKHICDNIYNEEVEYDFNLKEMGDYYYLSYETGDGYFIDKNHNDLVLNNLTINEESRILLADYLRYNMKKDEIDLAYTTKFLYDTYYENIDLSNLELSVDKQNVYIKFNDYNYTISLPLGYIQKYLNMNFGFEDIDYNERIHYVSPNRKVVAFTYDDGPNIKKSNPTSINIVKNLDTYDSSATFFVVGTNLYEDSINFIEESVRRGNEYGSHTQTHTRLTSLSLDKSKNDVYIPYNDLNNGFGYKMKYYRPPYGEYNWDVVNNIDLKCILWNVDSLDWKLRLRAEEDEAVKNVYNHTLKTAGENDVVLFHDIYKVSELASKEIMKTLIDEGYQVVNVSELLDYLDMNDVKLFGGK